MKTDKYKRTLVQLTENAVLFWPEEVLKKEASLSVLPLLLKTQEKFISILNLSDAGPESWNSLVDVSEELKGNLFLKHLMVLSDLGGEALNKLVPLEKYFNGGVMEYGWREQPHAYHFKAIAKSTPLHNAALRVDGKSLLSGLPLTEKMEDVIMLILHGSASIGDGLPADVKSKCMIGSLIGEPEELEKFVRQSYIRISRQIGGATSNALGQFAQDYVMEILKEELPNWELIRNGGIPGISHNRGRTETTFDIVARSSCGLFFGIEVSFQFTTNSVIERKSLEAKNRASLLHRAGHKICYVIDGAGNINVRKAAVGTICQFSDCTVAFSRPEIQVLAEFLREAGR